MEAEIIKMTLELYHAPPDACGVETSGGTESLFITCLTYREWGRKKGIKKPNIVASNTVHAGFDKACFYLGMELRKIPLTADYHCDFDAMRARVDSNTVCIVASCPDFALGYIDPVP
jgi:sphinganine-1-phosphate aldolase